MVNSAGAESICEAGKGDEPGAQRRPTEFLLLPWPPTNGWDAQVSVGASRAALRGILAEAVVSKCLQSRGWEVMEKINSLALNLNLIGDFVWLQL